MKNLEKKALIDLQKNVVPYLKLVDSSSVSHLQDSFASDVSEDFLFELENKFDQLIDIKKQELQEGLQEILLQEIKFFNNNTNDRALKYVIDNNDLSIDYDRETGNLYYSDTNSDAHLNEMADEEVDDCYKILAHQAYQASLRNGDNVIGR